MLVIRAGIHKKLVRIANREEYDPGLRCLSFLTRKYYLKFHNIYHTFQNPKLQVGIFVSIYETNICTSKSYRAIPGTILKEDHWMMLHLDPDQAEENQQRTKVMIFSPCHSNSI